MKLKAQLKICFFLIFSIPVFAFAAQVSFFTHNLYFGIQESGVTVLQQILNNDTDTIVSLTGAGSKGNETNYFGQKTKDAVIRFQNKYKNEILTPLGLSTGTGYVGELTRKKLDLIISNQSSSSIINKTTTSGVDTKSQTIKTPTITKITPDILNDGGTLTIYGSGFTDKNTVILSIEQPDKYSNIKSSNEGTVITLNINTSVGEKMIGSFKKAFENIPSDLRAIAIEKILKGIRKDNGQKESTNRTILVPTIVSVKNEFGNSNISSTTINIFKEI